MSVPRQLGAEPGSPGGTPTYISDSTSQASRDTDGLSFLCRSGGVGPAYAATDTRMSDAESPAGSTEDHGQPVERREFVATVLASAAALALRSRVAQAAAGTGTTSTAAPIHDAAAAIDVELRVNGASRRLLVDPRVTLLDALRERLGLTGTKKGCDHGQCGACTGH